MDGRAKPFAKKMNFDTGSQTTSTEPVDTGGYKKKDRDAYVGVVVYSLINIIWIVWVFSGAGFGIFDTAILIGLLLPILGCLILIVHQCSSRQNRFSILANLVSIFAIGGWFFFVWYIVAAESAAV